MEGLFMHGAAHVHFENKLADIEAKIDEKVSKLEKKFKKEMKEVFRAQMEEMRKVRREMRTLTEEVAGIRQSEEDISQLGMTQIRKLSKDVKDEVHDIRRIKNQVKHLKTEITDIKKVEEDISHVGMDQISQLNKELKTEICDLKNQINVLKQNTTKPEGILYDEDMKIEEKLKFLDINKDELNTFLMKALASYLLKPVDKPVKNMRTQDGSSTDFSSSVDSSTESSKLQDSVFSSQESHLECDMIVHKQRNKKYSPLSELPNEKVYETESLKNIEIYLESHENSKKQENNDNCDINNSV